MSFEIKSTLQHRPFDKIIELRITDDNGTKIIRFDDNDIRQFDLIEGVVELLGNLLTLIDSNDVDILTDSIRHIARPSDIPKIGQLLVLGDDL